MQYFSQWSPLSSPNRTQKDRRERDSHTPPQIERTKMKSAPSEPLLSEPILLGKELERNDNHNAEQDLQSKLDKNPFEALARHRSDRSDKREPQTPEPVMDVTTASIHPSEGSYASPYQGEHKYDIEDEDDGTRTPHEADPKHNGDENSEQEASLPAPTVPGLSMTFAEALTSSPKSPPPESPTETRKENEELDSSTRDPASPTLYQPEALPTEESDQTAIPSSPTTVPRRRSLLPSSLTSNHKRFSSGSMGVHFSPTSISPPASSQSATHASSQLDRIQALLTKTATQLHALERVQAANWERAVSMLMENAEQIAELRKGQETLGKTCEELRRTVEAGLDRGSQWEKYDIRRPPRKMGRKIVGYVYEKGGDEAGGAKTIVMERKAK